MGFSCGLIGLPNVGKSTIFNALCGTHVPAENYPFCTVEPNNGMVDVPDNRLDVLGELFHPEKLTHAVLEFIDIAGLVEGASHGQGLGNKFLSHIRDVDAVGHVIRCFWDENVAHSYTTVDPVRDAEVIMIELMLKDLEIIDKALHKAQANVRATGKTRENALLDVELLSRIKNGLERNTPVRNIPFSDREEKRLKEFSLLTSKPLFYIANIGEESINQPDDQAIVSLNSLAEREGTLIIPISAKIEAEMAQLSPDEKQEFMQDFKIKTSGLEKVVQGGYRLLNLITFFTIQGTEYRAWSLPRNTTAPKAAGKIHSDFERGFIKAEVISWEDLIQHKSETVCREKGLVRMEGRDYQIQDGDVIRFRFSV